MDLGLVGNVQAVGFLQGTLFVRIHVDVALDALLSVVGPRVPGHPLPLALGALVLAEATLLALVRRLAFGLGTSLRTISNVVALLEAQVTQIICRWNFAVLLILLAVIDPPQQRMLMSSLMLQMIRISSSTAQKRAIQTSSRSWTNPTIPKPIQALQTVGISVAVPGAGQGLGNVLRLLLLLRLVLMMMMTMVLMGMLLE